MNQHKFCLMTYLFNIVHLYNLWMAMYKTYLVIRLDLWNFRRGVIFWPWLPLTGVLASMMPEKVAKMQKQEGLASQSDKSSQDGIMEWQKKNIVVRGSSVHFEVRMVDGYMQCTHARNCHSSSKFKVTVTSFAILIFPTHRWHMIETWELTADVIFHSHIFGCYFIAHCTDTFCTLLHCRCTVWSLQLV
jgi:hypothetical protein